MPRGRKNLHKRGKKVSRHLQPYKRKPPTSALVAEAWGKNKTPSENYAAVGIVRDPNTLPTLRASALAVGGGRVEELIDGHAELPSFAKSKLSTAGQGRRPANFMREDEMAYLRLCAARHGEDYVAMARDIRTNVQQHSAEHLATRIARLRRLEARQEEAPLATEASAEVVGGKRKRV